MRPAPPASDVDSDTQPEPEKSKSDPSPNSQPSAKADKQLGAKGFWRTQKQAITHADNHFPSNCAVCDQSLSREGAQANIGRDEIDIANKTAGQAGFFLRVDAPPPPLRRLRACDARLTPCRLR